MKLVRGVLLIFIIVGIGLLITQAYWVPPLVSYLLSKETVPVVIPASSGAVSTHATGNGSGQTTQATSPLKQANGFVDGTVTIGPTCPVVQNPPNPSCADKPYQTRLIITSTNGSEVTLATDTNGHFTEALAPGTYAIRAASNASLPRLTPVTFRVSPSKHTSLTIMFDSGIR